MRAPLKTGFNAVVVVFIGILFFLPLATYQAYARHNASFWLWLAATLVYVICVSGVTAMGNGPLNNQLEQFQLAIESVESIQTHRLAFEPRWNQLNKIRTVCSVVAVLSIVLATLFRNDPGSV